MVQLGKLTKWLAKLEKVAKWLGRLAEWMEKILIIDILLPKIGGNRLFCPFVLKIKA
jgi:hypothetical protein